MKKTESSRLKITIEGAKTAPDWSKALAFAEGEPPLLPAICQDAATGQVLMLGYMSQEALEESLDSGQVVFWSRSRRRIWKKGETSGNVMNISRVFLDCDADTLLFFVLPQGPVCHRESVTCFDAEREDHCGFQETDVGWSVAARLFKTLEQRARGDDSESYTFKLLKAGVDRVLRKLGEECTETILAAKNATITENADEFLQESADLLYHWFVSLIALKKNPFDVMDVLRARELGPRRVQTEKV